MEIYEILACFLIYSFLGWCVEVIYHVVRCGKVINRGYLNGPVCPIYGFGMLAVLICLQPLGENRFFYFLGGMLLATLIELIGGWGLYHFFHQRWWDYSDEPFNLGGYICLRFSIAWGLGIVLIMDMVHPLVLGFVGMIPRLIGIAAMIVLYAGYAADCAVTTATVLKMKKQLEHLEQIAAAMREISDALTQKLGSGTMEVERVLDEGRQRAVQEKSRMEERAEAAKDRFASRLKNTREELESRYCELQELHDETRRKLQEHKWLGSGRILSAFPDLTKHRMLHENKKKDGKD